jgi:hypothetical protein
VNTTRVTDADSRGIGYVLIGNIYAPALEPSAVDIGKSVDMIARLDPRFFRHRSTPHG